MKKWKICVYAICKNEEQFVDRWMDAVSEADLVVVTDTGSADGTAKRLRERGAVVYEEVFTPWRFDTSRNAAMDHIPEDVDICVSNDLDEVFEPGWREKLEATWTEKCTRARYLFTWSYRPDGRPDKQFAMEKIHARRGFRWVHPVHEVLKYSGPLEDNTVWVPGLVLNHYPDQSKPRSQYLPLLELSVKENPENDRAAFWLGREYLYHGNYEKSIQTLQSYLDMPSAVWDEERCAALRLIGECLRRQGKYAEARAWLYRAVAECPRTREPWADMATLGYLTGDWPLTYAMALEGLAITAKTGSYLTEPRCWDHSLDDLAAIAAYRLGLYEKARVHAVRACALSPDNPRLTENLRLIQLKCGGEGGAEA